MVDNVLGMVLEQFGSPLQPRDLLLPELEPGALLVRVLAAGICGSDLDIVAGQDPRVPLPLIPGHEAIGEVMAVGGERRDAWGSSVRIGSRIAFNRGLTCGRCFQCAVQHRPELCPERQTFGISLPSDIPPYLNGCYAEYVYVRPASEIFPLPEDTEPIGMVAATCSGATAAHAVELAGVTQGDLVAVIGAGPLGLFAAALARENGARTVTVSGTGRNPQQLRLAEATGCLPLHAGETTLEERRKFINGLGQGRGADVVLDCAGTPDSFQEALALVGCGGTVVLPGVATPMSNVELDPYLLSRNQVKVQGVWASGPRHLWQALQVAASGRYPLDAIVSHVLPLQQANEALQLMRERTALKVVLVSD